MKGIILEPVATNPVAGAPAASTIWTTESSGLISGKIGAQTIVTDAKLPDGTYPYQFLFWGDGTNKWEVSAPGATLNAQTIPISGKSSAEMTSNGTLGLLGSDLTRLGNAVGGSLTKSCIDITPSTINIISGSPGKVQANGTDGTSGQALGITPSNTFGWISPGANWAEYPAVSTIQANGNRITNVSSITSGTLSFTPTVETIYTAAKNYAGGLAGLQIQNTSPGVSSSGNIYISGNNATETTNYTVMGKNSTGYNSGSNYLSEKPKQLYIGDSDADITLMPSFLGGNGATHLAYENGVKAVSVAQDGSISLGTTFDTLTQNFVYNKGAANQVIMSQGDGLPAVWSTISGGGGGGVTSVTANAPLSVVNGTTTPDISLDVSSITSTLVKEVVCLDGTLNVTEIPGVTGKTSQVSLANVGTSGFYTNVANITTNTKGQVTSVTSYGIDQPVLSLSVGTGLSNVGTAQNPYINNTGVLSVNAGTGIASSGGSNPTISNSGVLSVSVGSGISNVGTSQNPNLINDGVLSFTAGTGLVNVGTSQNPSVNNDGVLELTAGTNVTITGTKSNYTINASGGSAPTDYVKQVNSNGGAVSLNTVTPSSGSIILGSNAANVATIGSNNIVQGSGAFNFTTVPGTAPTNNVVIGNGAGAGQGNYQMTGMNIIGISADANGFRQQQDGVAIGTQACSNGACWESVVIGKQTAFGLNDDRSVYIGPYTGRNHGAGFGNVAIGLNALDGGGTGSGNVAIGFQNGIRVQGDENIYIGANVGNQNYGTPKVESGITVIGRKYGDPASNFYDGFYMDGYAYKAGLWATSPAQITAGAPCLNIAGDLIVDNISRTGDLEFTNATLSGTSGGNSGQHLRLLINGTYYKIALLND